MNRDRPVGVEELGRDPDSEDVSAEREVSGKTQEMAPKNRKGMNTKPRKSLSSLSSLREYCRSLP